MLKYTILSNDQNLTFDILLGVTGFIAIFFTRF